jgi:hypothetical protein
MGRLAAMDLFRARGSRSRYVALAAVIGLHVLLIFGAQRISTLSFDVVADKALVWLRLDQPIATPRPEELPQQERVPTRNVPPRPEQPQIPETRSSSEQLPTAPAPPRQIDWRANAARSAERAVEAAGQERYRSFGPRKEPAPGEPPVPSAFGEPPKHKYGDVDTEGGDPVVYMNENCYTELDKPVQTASDWVNGGPGSFAPPKIRCKFSGSTVDGKLFEHIKKREEPPVPKAGTEMNELPERVEEVPKR